VASSKKEHVILASGIRLIANGQFQSAFSLIAGQSLLLKGQKEGLSIIVPPLYIIFSLKIIHIMLLLICLR